MTERHEGQQLTGALQAHGLLDQETARRMEADPLEQARPGLPAVAGRRMTQSHEDFERACLVLLDEEQRKIAPDNHLIATLCDAVRLSREHVDTLENTIPVRRGRIPEKELAQMAGFIPVERKVKSSNEGEGKQ